MNILFNFNSLIENNANYIFKLLITIFGSSLAIIPIVLQIKSNRTNKVFEDIISKRLKSHEVLIKFLVSIPKNNVFIKNYTSCKLIWNNKHIIPYYYKIFENINSLNNFKKNLDKNVLEDYTLNYKVYKGLFFMQSYIDTCILWFKVNEEFIKKNPNIKFFLSMDFHKLISKTWVELNKFYNNQKFQKFSKIPNFYSLYKIKLKLEFFIKCRFYYIAKIRKYKKQKNFNNLGKNFSKKYNCCINCKNKCKLKVK